MKIYFILLNLFNHCNPYNKSTYLIPDANYCNPTNLIGGDKYYFGPYYVNKTKYLNKCRYAKGRDKYCIGNDGHFCAFLDKGIFKNYYIVECG